MRRHEQLSIFTRWSDFLSWLLDTTEKFPKKIRFTISSRLDNIALDILEKIIEAVYTKEKIEILKEINLQLEKMRVILRICCNKQYLSKQKYDYSIKELYEIGKMLGGWIKQQNEKL